MKKEEKFSLKDHLFNEEKVEQISLEIKSVHSDFAAKQFAKEVLGKFPELELMERVYWIRDCLTKYLPSDFKEAVKILLESLPPPCDPTLSDDDFGDFIYLPYSFYVVEHGCNEKYLDFSLEALKVMTTRFSVEGPIRFFLNDFPKETMQALELWIDDEHYHVRRLVSEGTRPNLPWAKKIDIDYREPVSFLNKLYTDKARFVTRSVANHLNDISKVDPKFVIKTLKNWQNENKQSKSELEFITKHSLRTLVKQGNKEALKLLGYSAKNIKVQNFSVKDKLVKVGEAIEFSFDVKSISNGNQNLMIDYLMHFRKANGELSPKTHKIAKKTIKGKETLTINKKHPLRIMTTRKLYPGEHKIELQINGVKYGSKKFVLSK